MVLIIRDGWGSNPYPQWNHANAVHLAKTPVDDRLMAEYPYVLIRTCGNDVGLPDGVSGNSEVGHQNIGAGRIVEQEIMRITGRIRDGSFFRNHVLLGAFARASRTGGSVHIVGLCSDGRVHSDLDHLRGLLEMSRKVGFPGNRVFVHAFTDGRDTAPSGGIGYVEQVETWCRELGINPVASVIGRYFAMDRDNRWDRVQLAYRMLVDGQGARFETASAAVADYYEHPSAPDQQGDEFVTPRVVATLGPQTLGHSERSPSHSERNPSHSERSEESPALRRGENLEMLRCAQHDSGLESEPGAKTRAGGEAAPAGSGGYPAGIRDGDSVIFFNYRGDRPRQLTKAFTFDEFPYIAHGQTTGSQGFDRGRKLDLYFATMTAYEEGLPVHVAFPKPASMADILGAYLAEKGLTQFRCAETEKYAHVTFFFNDYRDEPFPGESRQIIPSPRDVATYDQKPQMSAYEVTDAVVRRIESADDDLIVVNYANGDMVGHTGDLHAAIRAIEVVDECVGRIVDAVRAKGGALIITADHGNCEQMIDPKTGGPHTSHTPYDVELIVVDDRYKGRLLRRGGRLADIAPTILHLLALPQPPAMTGQSLLPDPAPR